MTLRDQQLRRSMQNQCPEHNGETFCVKQGYPKHAGECKFLPADEAFQALYPEAGEWKTELRIPERVEAA